MRLGAILLAVLLLPSAAAARGEADVDDARGDGAGPTTDLLGGALLAERDGLRFVVEMASPGTRDHAYYVLFTLAATGREVAALVGAGRDGAMRGHLARDLDELDTARFDRIANDRVLDARQDGALYSGLIPWGAFPELEPGARLVDWSFGSMVFVGTGWRAGGDTAEGVQPFAAHVRTSLFPILVPAWVIPTIVLVCLAGGMSGGWWVARLTTPALPPPAPKPSWTPPPPGQRFQRAPPRP